MIDAGGLTGVDWLFGLHCDPKLDVGPDRRAGRRRSPRRPTSSTIRLHGPGGHTARPQLTVDLVAVAGPARGRAARTRCATLDPSLNLVFGALHAGDAANVIPATAELRGTLRTPDRDAWDAGAGHARNRAATRSSSPTGATYELDHERGVPPVVNDEQATALLAAAAVAVLGADAVVPTEQSAGGDDFAWYAEQVPSTYVRLGVHDPASTGPRQRPPREHVRRRRARDRDRRPRPRRTPPSPPSPDRSPPPRFGAAVARATVSARNRRTETG